MMPCCWCVCSEMAEIKQMFSLHSFYEFCRLSAGQNPPSCFCNVYDGNASDNEIDDGSTIQ